MDADKKKIMVLSARAFQAPFAMHGSMERMLTLPHDLRSLPQAILGQESLHSRANFIPFRNLAALQQLGEIFLSPGEFPPAGPATPLQAA
jgi:hypothetical protein